MPAAVLGRHVTSGNEHQDGTKWGADFVFSSAAAPLPPGFHSFVGKAFDGGGRIMFCAGSSLTAETTF